jgi:hypothetical protein
VVGGAVGGLDVGGIVGAVDGVVALYLSEGESGLELRSTRVDQDQMVSAGLLGRRRHGTGYLRLGR